MKDTVLKNGIRMLTYPMPWVHSVTLGLYTGTGSRQEPEEKSGITHFLEHIHFRKLRGMTQDELYYKMESMGSTLRAATYYDFVRFSMKARPEYLPGCVDIIRRIIETDEWAEDDVRAELSVIENQLEERDYGNTFESLQRGCIYGDSALSRCIMGELSTVRGITHKDLSVYKKDVFSADNLLLCVTGCFSDTALDRVASEIGELPLRAGCYLPDPDPIPRLCSRGPDVKLCNDGWNELEVCISFDVCYASVPLPLLRLLNCILGEGVGSRLQRRIREKDGYTSDIYSEVEAFRDFAVLRVRFSVASNRFTDCFTAVLMLLRDMKSDIEQRDLDVSLPFYTDNLVFSEDDSEQKNFELAYNSFVLGITQMLAEDRSLLLRSLTSAAGSLFVPGNSCVAILGDCAQTSEESISQRVTELLGVA